MPDGQGRHEAEEAWREASVPLSALYVPAGQDTQMPEDSSYFPAWQGEQVGGEEEEPQEEPAGQRVEQVLQEGREGEMAY